ncbi:T9SS type A sorting domain-containing protein [bacterium]|nr:T9SS type A sorting domain-containing protein [bacterium]
MKKFEYIFLLLATLSVSLGCTIAVFAPDATEYGRPMLWKNRDVPNYRQQYIYVEDEHRFISITYQGVDNQVYGGANDAGFGIVNTDTYNQGPNQPYGLTDGQVMYLALSHCENVWDFIELMDSLIADTTAGLRSTHCYGIMDKYGNTGIVESNCTSYVYFSANSSPDRYLVRTNFAISGDDSDRRGYDRYIHARASIDTLLPISVDNIWSVASDLVTDELNPNPLPFDGTFGTLPYGYINTTNTLNRFLTTSYQIIVGQNFSDDLSYPVVWGGFGQPYYTAPIPMWVKLGFVNETLTGNDNYFCTEGRFLWEQIYDCGSITYFNTFPAQTIYNFLQPLRNSLWNMYDKYVSNWNKEPADSAHLVDIQDDFVSMAAYEYEQLHGLLVRERHSQKPGQISITAYPNPFNSTSQISIEIPYQKTAEFIIMDISGKIVFQKTIVKEIDNIIWHPTNLSSGTYLAILRCENSTASKKLLFIK